MDCAPPPRQITPLQLFPSIHLWQMCWYERTVCMKVKTTTRYKMNGVTELNELDGMGEKDVCRKYTVLLSMEMKRKHWMDVWDA